MEPLPSVGEEKKGGDERKLVFDIEVHAADHLLSRMTLTEPDHLAYRYSPLSDPSTQVRILQLHPASSKFDLVACSLQVQDVPIAAAYVIHEPVDDSDAPRDYAILCDNSLIAVSEETHFALQNLRNQSDERLRRVWSPRVCIDTTNEDEQRALQLRVARLLYQHASQRICMTPSYKHGPLGSDTDAIRVIELEDGNGRHPSNGLLKTRMRVVSLRDKPRFFYLDIREGLTSDSWPDKTPILCNGRLLNLATPLAQVLSAVLRNAVKGPRAFWTPSICHDKEADAALDSAMDQRIRREATETVGIMQPIYTYTPLPQERPHIRLLKILPAASLEDVLVVDIAHFPLDEASCPPFVALSYVWGSPDPPWMVCTRDGRYIVCTESLRLALCHLRDRGELIVWADAVCINQRDDGEKSSQVLLMGEIYKRASRVVVELGMTCANDKHLVCRSYLRALLNMLSLTARTLGAVRPERADLRPGEYGSFGIPSYGHQAWGAWRAMRSVSWFTRSWIVQEVTASRDVTLLYNGQSFRWEDIYLSNGITAREQVDSKTYNGKMNIQNMGDLQNITDASRRPKLLDLLSIFRSLEATNPRDKIYAFRGLASDGDDSPLPDYSRTVEDIYVDFASFFVQKGLTGRLLLEAGRNRSARDSMPSWVPDWSNTTSWQIYSFAKQSAWISLSSMQKRHSLEEGQQIPTTGGIIEEGRMLRTRARIVDQVDALSSPVSNTFLYEHVAERERIDKEVLELYKNAQEMVTKLSLTDEGITTETIHAAVQRTLLGGSDKLFNTVHAFYDRSKIMGTIQDDASANAVTSFDEHLRERLSDRRFCTTKHGRMGIVPSMTRADDRVYFVEGVECPFILRDDDSGRHTLIGDAFVLDPTGSDRDAYGTDGGYSDVIIV